MDDDEEDYHQQNKSSQKGEDGIQGHRDCKIYVSTNTGNVICYDLKKLFNNEDFELEIVEQASKRANYNPYRDKNQDFRLIISNAKVT